LRAGTRGAKSRRRKKPFRLEEATIDELHQAIKAGQTTCVAIVQHYIDRARAFNGVCSLLVTEDGTRAQFFHKGPDGVTSRKSHKVRFRRTGRAR